MSMEPELLFLEAFSAWIIAYAVEAAFSVWQRRGQRPGMILMRRLLSMTAFIFVLVPFAHLLIEGETLPGMREYAIIGSIHSLQMAILVAYESIAILSFLVFMGGVTFMWIRRKKASEPVAKNS